MLFVNNFSGVLVFGQQKRRSGAQILKRQTGATLQLRFG